MPLYEYRCHRCGQTFEVLQKFSDEPVSVHEDCGGEVERLISTSSFQLKGSGWYATDYPRNGKSSSAPANATPEFKAAQASGKFEAPKTGSNPPAATPSSSEK